ncbi:hypothetical protein BDQ12DRAFT_625737, partial [Crucibulum laeve]
MNYCLACLGLDKKAEDEEPLLGNQQTRRQTRPNLKDPLPAESPSDKLVDILVVLNAGKLPSQEQINHLLRFLLKSDLLQDDATTKVMQGTGPASEKGRKVVRGVHNVAQALLQFGMEKNDDDKFQDLIFQLSQIEGVPVRVDVDPAFGAAGKAMDAGKAGASQLREDAPSTNEIASDLAIFTHVLRTLFHTFLTSSIFRLLLVDAMDIARELVAHVAVDIERAAVVVKDAAEEVRETAAGVEQRAKEDNLKTDGGVEKLKGKGRDVLEGMLEGGRNVHDEWEEVGREVEQDAKTKLIQRLQEIMHRAQQDPSTRKAIHAMLLLIGKYADKLSTLSSTASSTLSSASPSSTYPPQPYPTTSSSGIGITSPYLSRALSDLKVLLERLGRVQSIDPLLDAFSQVMRDLGEIPGEMADSVADRVGNIATEAEDMKLPDQNERRNGNNENEDDESKQQESKSKKKDTKERYQPNPIRKYFKDISLYIDRGLSEPGWATSEKGTVALTRLVDAGIDLVTITSDVVGDVVVDIQQNIEDGEAGLIPDKGKSTAPAPGSELKRQFAFDIQRFINELDAFATKIEADRTTMRLLRAFEGLGSDIQDLLGTGVQQGKKTAARTARRSLLGGIGWMQWLSWGLPRLLKMIPPSWVPIPRVEVKSGSIEGAIEALWLKDRAQGGGSGGIEGKLVPDEIILKEWSEIRVDMREEDELALGSRTRRRSQEGRGETKISSSSRIHMHADGIRASIAGLGYYIRYGGSVLGYEDEGVLSIDAGVDDGIGSGIGVDIEIELENVMDTLEAGRRVWHADGTLPIDEGEVHDSDTESALADFDGQRAVSGDQTLLHHKIRKAQRTAAPTVGPALVASVQPLFRVIDVRVALEGLHFRIDHSKHWILNTLLVQPLAGPAVSRLVKSAAEEQMRKLLAVLALGFGRLQAEAKKRGVLRRQTRTKMARRQEMRRIGDEGELEDEEDVYVDILGDWCGAIIDTGPEAFGHSKLDDVDEDEDLLIETDTNIHPTTKGIVYTSSTITTQQPTGHTVMNTNSETEEVDTSETVVAIGAGPQLFPGKGGPYRERNDAEEEAAGERRRFTDEARDVLHTGVGGIKKGIDIGVGALKSGEEGMKRATERKAIRKRIESDTRGW